MKPFSDSSPATVKAMALYGDRDRFWANQVAIMLQRGLYQDAGALIENCKRNDHSFLSLVAEAIKDGSKFQPTATRRRLIVAWIAAAQKHARDFIPKPKSLQEWNEEFEDLFPDVRLPTDATFLRAARELHLLYGKARAGRPKGSRDSEPRKRRPKILNKFRVS